MLERSTARTGDPDWPKEYPMPLNIMLSLGEMAAQG